MASNQDEKTNSSEDILSAARERFHLALDAEKEFREVALEDLRFRAGEQWPDEIKRSRELDKRPCLTINKIPQFVRQVTNEQRQNRPSIKISPVDSAADIDTAKIIQGMIKHIEYSSNADVAYDRAFESAVIKGLGYFRIVTDYSSPTSFNQEAIIKSIQNSSTVLLDPSYQEPDGSDANWGLIYEDLTKEEFESRYPDAELCSMDDWESLGDEIRDWVKKDGVRVAEYFYKTFKEVDICQLSDGKVYEKSKLPESLPAGLSVVSERKTILPAIKWCKLNGYEILEKTDWAGSWIPIIPVQGDEIILNGKRIFEGVIRHAKDSQRMYNFWKSSETETIALAPRAPWIGVEGQFEGHENEWATANTKNHAYLEVKPLAVGGQPAGLPQRNVFEPPIMAITQASAMASDDMKATTGIYDASLGNRSNESSGRAIERRNAQAQTSNFHFVDNLSRSIKHAGRILVELIPKIYDTPQAIRTLGDDGSVEIVKINQMFEKDGESKIFDLGAGKYDVTVETGPSYQTKRQEAVDAMIEFTKAMPQQAGNIADLIVKNMDWVGSSEIAERLRKLLPPGLVEPKDGEQKPQIPPEYQAKMDQMGQMLDQVTHKLNVAQDKLDSKTLELESKERIEMAKIKTEIEIEMAKIGSKESMTLLAHEVAQIQSRLEQLDYNEPIEQNENLNDAGGEPAMAPEQNQQTLTGESSPG